MKLLGLLIELGPALDQFLLREALVETADLKIKALSRQLQESKLVLKGRGAWQTYIQEILFFDLFRSGSIGDVMRKRREV